MIKKLRILLILLAVVAVPYGIYKWNYPTYSWHQKLTVEVETPRGVVSGSAVSQIVVDYFPQIFPEAISRKATFTGEATVVDLGDGKYLFALTPRYIGLASNVFYGQAGKELDRQEKESLLSGLRASRVVQPENYPLLVTFDDITKPETVKRVEPDDLAATFGAGYALEVVTLEITDEAVTQGRVEALIDWYRGFPEPGLCPATGRTTNIPFCRRVEHGDFIRK